MIHRKESVPEVPIHDFRLWTHAFRWDELDLLAISPPLLANWVLGKELGDLQRNPIITIHCLYPNETDQEKIEARRAYLPDVVIEGVVGTNVITARILKDPPPITQPPLFTAEALDPERPVHIVLRRDEPLAYVHFHLGGEPRDVLFNTLHLLKRPEELIDVLDEEVAKVTPDRVTDEYNAPRDFKRLTIRKKTSLPLRLFHYEFSVATWQAGGCHSCQGWYTSKEEDFDVHLDAAYCITYSPPPPPPPPQ